MERLDTTESIPYLYAHLLESEPKLVTNFVPEKQNAQKQKGDFLSGDIRNPDHVYDKLDAIDFDDAQAKIEIIGQSLFDHPDLNPKHISSYEEFVEGYKKKTRLMELARAFKNADDEGVKAQLKQEYMQLNIELYGEPDETTYRSLMQEKLSRIDQKHLVGSALQLQNELFEMVSYVPNDEKYERFSPSGETVEWMQEVADTLYGNMLSHVPEKDKFSVKEVRSIFTEIIEQEFGESAEGWKVDIESAKSINVKSTEKRIVIPEDRGEISYAALRGLVVHEIGVHMLRSVTGGETDLLPLQNGLNDYYDAEEGLGVVMEQSLKGKFSESGVEPYITAGLAYYDNKDFRDAFEIKWRLSVLNTVDDSGEITEAAIAKAKNTAYGSVMRSMRGTDELPWFKDLAYYNGSIDVWRHLETIKGDDLKFMFVLLGKANPANRAHERILLETRTI
ncbi:DUF1704 domain-containing protein [Candidatus Saccharibacteria bacterium]|nr:DUF1704 domain-containing protein [Candidatus Saccharibacteria bacterium]